MSEDPHRIVATDAAPQLPGTWSKLRQLTDSRIALGRTGGSLRVTSLLDFRLAHARARDAVHAEFQPDRLAEQFRAHDIPTVELATQAKDRACFLQRPDLGRRLEFESAAKLEHWHTAHGDADVVLIVSDGLSATAAHAQAVPTVIALHALLTKLGRTLAPVLLVSRGRVKLQDEIGERMRATHTVMLLGERPGLGSPDSLGAYFTHRPQHTCSDADRNCVSNIRPAGLAPADAAHKLAQLLTESLRLGLSGVKLKDDQLPPLPPDALRPRIES